MAAGRPRDAEPRLRYDPRAIATLDKAAALVDLAQSTGFTPITEAFSRNPTLHNWEPRVGIAFDPSANRTTSIRAGYGVFHSPITANRFGPAYALNPPFALGVQVRLPFPPVPVFPTPNPSASQISQMQALDYDMADSPRLQQWNVNVQHEILRNTSVTVAYVGSRGDRLQRQRDTNPVTPRTLANGTVVYGSRAGAQTISNPRVNPVFGALISANSYAESDYHSLQAALNRRFTATCSRSCPTRCRAAAIRRLETRRSKAAPPRPTRTTSATTTVRVWSIVRTTCARAPSTCCPSPQTRSCLDGRSRPSSAPSAARRSRRSSVSIRPACRRGARSGRTWCPAARSTTR